MLLVQDLINMTFLKQIKLAYFALQKFADEQLLNSFDKFCDFAYKRFSLLNLENQDVSELSKIYYGLLLNLDKLKSNTLDESNLITPVEKNFVVTYYETYNQLIRYTYKKNIKAPTAELAKKSFTYSVDQGYIDNDSHIDKEYIDSEFGDEGIISVDEEPNEKNIKESTRKIVKELYERKLNK